MKRFRFFAGFTMLLLIAGCAYAYVTVNRQEAAKIDSLKTETKQLAGDANRGEYVAVMGGCVACHTNYADGGEAMAGGVPIKTAFGTFYSPNITSDKTAGIGHWTTDEFLIAMAAGRSPNGEHYFPAFPYTSYSVMSVQNLVDLKAWLDTVEPVSNKAPKHDIAWPFSNRPTILLWKLLFFNPLRTIDSGDRGRYIVNGPGHCSECHSPRNLLGGLTDRSLVGNSRGPDGESVPGITSADLSEWSVEDVELFLEVGITLSGDFTGGHMADVIEYSTGLLSSDDRTLIAEYLLSEHNAP